MKDLKTRVEETIKWKKSNKYCAKKLNIPLDLFMIIKDQVIQEKRNRIREEYLKEQREKRGVIETNIDIEKGEATLSASFDNEPKTPEEIIELLKIDTTQWKLSNYWNKQMSDHWRVSALVTRIKQSEENFLENLIKNWEPKKHKIPSKIFNKKDDLKTVCGIISLQDIHFGKEGNNTIDKDFEETIISLLSNIKGRYFVDNMFFVIGGDLINMDTFLGTTTSGTPLDNSMTATEAYIQAFDCMHWAIKLIKAFCSLLTIVYVPGNHDRLSSFHLVHALSKSIDCDQIVWDIKYEERKVHTWGDNFNAFEHGDATSKNTPLVYASEFPNQWGRSKYRTLYTGHFHQSRKVEYVTTSETVGFVHKTLPSLSKADYYHYHKKYVGNRRSGILELQSLTKGTISEYIHTVG